MQRWLIRALLLLTTLLGVATSSAQGNLLRDGDFEGAYTSRGRGDLNVPADWNIWVATAPRTEAWMNLDPVGFPHNGPGPNPQNGARAVNFNRGFATFTVAIYQTVAVPRGTNVIGSAFAYLKTCNPAPNADNCGSAVESGAFTRVGIDTAGGSDPNSPSIIWSNNAQPHDRWEQMTVSATAAADNVTLFIYVTQRFPAQINNVYFDNASLSGGGAGGVAPGAAPGAPAATIPPPPPANVPFVVAQGEQPDGSIQHTVQPGDTVDSIAVAYGVTRQDILTLNDIRDPRIIQVGQRLLIRPAAPANTGSGAAESTAASAPATARPTRTFTGITATTAPAAAEATQAPVAAETTPEAPVAAETTPEAAAPTAAPLDLAALPTAPVRSAASGSVLPAIDPASPNGQICVLMFDDANQNRIQDADEAALAGGSVLFVRSGETVADYTTDGSEPNCGTELTAGDTIASIAPPDGYGLTTPDQLQLRVAAGARVNLTVGAAQGVQAPVIPADTGAPAVIETTDTTVTPASNPLLDNLGLIALGGAALTLLVGGGVAFALRRR
jgi:LysM repeat protein